MIELAQHIEALLLENDCVIIPDFGGFVAHHTSAKRIESENRFLPPTRTLGFNSQLKLNDGLLVQSYMVVYDLNFPDASRRIKEEVDKLIEILHEEGKIDFPNIGEIQYTIHDTYEFRPYNEKVTTPYLYGIDAFEMRTLSAIKQPIEKKVRIYPNSVKKQKSYDLSISRTFLRSAAAVAAAVMLFFYLSTPVENTYIEKENYALLLPVDLFEKIETQSVMTTPIVVKKEPKQPSKATVKTVSRKKETQKNVVKPIAVKEVKVPLLPSPVQTQTDGDFHIIVAGGISQKDAEAMVNQLKKEGHVSAQVLTRDGKVRVSILSLATREEATRRLLELRENETYKTAWMLAK